jgi:hypothetical protein
MDWFGILKEIHWSMGLRRFWIVSRKRNSDSDFGEVNTGLKQDNGDSKKESIEYGR